MSRGKSPTDAKPKQTTTMTNTLTAIRTLSESARKLFAEILIEGDLASRKDFEGRDGWDELTENDMVNCWDDDAENQYCEIGSQA